MNTPVPSVLESIPQLEPEIPAEQFSDPMQTAVICGSIVLLLLIVAAVFYILRRRRKTAPEATVTPLQACDDALDALEAHPLPLREACIRLSLILRQFMAGQAQDTSLFETHEEFSRRVDALSSVPIVCRNAAHILLNELAEYKYTGEADDNPAAVRTLTVRTRELVHAIALEQLRQSAIETPQTAC